MAISRMRENSKDVEMTTVEQYAGRLALFEPNAGHELTIASPPWFTRIDLLGGLAAAELYWLYAIFVVHVFTISVYVTDRSTNLRVVSGRIGDLGEVIHGAGLFTSLMISFSLFALVWCLLRRSAWAFLRWPGTAELPEG
jgi:hypothetical protein